MSTDYTAIVGFGVDLGKSRPDAVFGAGAKVGEFDPYDQGPFHHAVEVAGHAFRAYSREHGRYFLFVPGTARLTTIHEVGTFEVSLDSAKVQAFTEWCRAHALDVGEPKWLFTCYAH
jgi:hypothetical protein